MVTQRSIKISEENYSILSSMKIVSSESYDCIISRMLKVIKEKNIKWEVKRANGTSSDNNSIRSTISP